MKQEHSVVTLVASALLFMGLLTLMPTTILFLLKSTFGEGTEYNLEFDLSNQWVIFVAICIIDVVAAFGLFSRKRWGWYLALSCALVPLVIRSIIKGAQECLHACWFVPFFVQILVVLIGVVGFYALFKPEIRAEFSVLENEKPLFFKLIFIGLICTAAFELGVFLL